MAPAASSNQSPKTVCVMDASGRLGSSLVQKLLQMGYNVHAALQNHGESIFNGCENKKLKIFHSDPFDYKSIIDAIRGCSALLYTFEPPHYHPNYDETMAEVEVRAAHNVLEACAQTETIDKIIFTSSVTSVIWRDDRPSPTSYFDERYWSDVNFCRKFKLWHAMSKTSAEKTAWALAMDRGVNMVAVNAGLLTTPDLSIDNPYLRGATEMFEDGLFVTVDLNFLVDAHICVFQDVSSYGRYLCFNRMVNRHEDALELARHLIPSSTSLCESKSNYEERRIIEQRISNNKLNKLMVGFESEPQGD